MMQNKNILKSSPPSPLASIAKRGMQIQMMSELAHLNKQTMISTFEAEKALLRVLHLKKRDAIFD